MIAQRALEVEMDLPRPWRRKIKPLGTLGGNPSEVDDVLSAGPPMNVADPDGGPDLGFFAEERAAAVHGDLLRDVSSDFDAEADAENHMWDSLGKKDDDTDVSDGER
jgi:hypothetical protein